MLTRREILVGTIAVGAVMRTRTGFAKAAQPATPVSFDVPAGACDCHTHIHGDPEKFPFFPGRVYTPEMALPEEMAALHKALHMRRVVIVTPSVYGTDNSATLYGMKARGADARGVAVIGDKTPESELDAMGGAGVCGIRLNLRTGGTDDPAVGRQRFQSAVERMKSRNWHVQMYTNLAMISAIKDLVAASPVPVVFDHFGGARAELGPAAARLPRAGGPGPVGEGLCENLGRLSRLEARPGLCRRRAAGQSADCREPRAHCLGHGLAASGLGHAARAEADARESTAPNR
jgi:amidohydrolase family protein